MSRRFPRVEIAMVMVLMAASILAAACGSIGDIPPAAGEGGHLGGGGGGAGAPGSGTDVITVAHDLGETPVQANPETVVVFSFGVLDSLDKMGVEIAGLPKASLPLYLEKYNQPGYENLGSLVEPDFEKINALSPDLIIISGRQADAYEELSFIGPTIYLDIDPTRYVESFEENARILGAIFRKEEYVEAELKRIAGAITDLKRRVADAGASALVVLANEGNINVYGPNSRFGLIYDVFGFDPVDPTIEVSTHGQSVSFEYLVKYDPDYLFVIDRGSALGGPSGAAALIENELTQSMKAIRNGNVIYLDSDVWYLSGGGLASMERMVKEVSGAIP